MIYAKYKYTTTISGGSASINTDQLKGRIEQIIVTPTTSTTAYDFSLIDRDGDILYSRTTETGTVNDGTANLPVGMDSLERLTIRFSNSTANEKITTIFKILEQY